MLVLLGFLSPLWECLWGKGAELARLSLKVL